MQRTIKAVLEHARIAGTTVARPIEATVNDSAHAVQAWLNDSGTSLSLGMAMASPMCT